MKWYQKFGLGLVAAIGIATAVIYSVDYATAAPVSTGQPQDANGTGFSVPAVSNGTAKAWAIISAQPAGIAKVETISGYSDLGTAQFQAYYTTNSSTITNAATVAAGTNTLWGPQFTNFAANDIVVIQYKGSNSAYIDFYERNTVSSVSPSNCVLTWTNQFPLNFGDVAHRMVAGARIANFALTNVLLQAQSGGGLFYGQEGRPLLIELNGTAAANIYGVSGSFWRRSRP